MLAGLIQTSANVVAVFSQPDRPAGRGRRLRASPVKQLAEDAGIPLYQPQTLREQAAWQQLEALSADILVVVAYGLILPPEVLALPALGCLNIHASLLPRWRGAAPIQHALLAGDQESGISLMQMDEGLDTGPVLARKSLTIAHDETAATLHDRLAIAGRDLLLENLPLLATANWSAEVQPETGACYAAKISKADAEIDWQLPAHVLDRRIRAYNPWPVAFSHWLKDKQRLRIWRAKLLPEISAAAGEVVAVDRSGIDVAAASGGLRLTEIQAAGGKRLAAAEYLNAHSIEIGDMLGCPEATN